MNNYGNNPFPPQMKRDNTKIFSILSYIWMLFIVGLLVEPDNPKIRFHANQGLVLFLLWLILRLLVKLFKMYFKFIPILGKIASFYVSAAVYLVLIVYTIIGIVNVINDEQKPLPYIGRFTLIR